MDEYLIGFGVGMLVVYFPMALALRNRERLIQRLIRDRNEKKLAEYMSKLGGE